ELRDRDLEAEFSLTGLPCRLVQISGQSGIVHLLAPDLAVLKSKRKDMGFYNMRLQAFHKDLFYETVGWKAGNAPVLLDADDKKLPKHACLRLVVPDIIRVAKAKLPVAPPGLTELGEGKKDLWEEVWAATVSERTVLFEHVRNMNWGVKQPDIVAKLINLQDTDTVDAWHKNPALPRIMVRLEEGEIYVSGAFLQAHCKKLSLEMSPRSERERLASKAAAGEGRGCQASRGCEMADAQPADDKPQPAEDVEMPDAKPAEEADDKPAELQAQEPADQAEDVEPADAEPAVADAAGPDELQDRLAEEGDDKPAEQAEDEAEPAVAEDAKPAEEGDAKPPEQAEAEAEPAAEPDAPAPAEPEADAVAGPVQGLRTTDKGDGWHELLARTLEEYTADLEIIKRSVNDGTIDKVSVRWSPTRWTQEIYHINSQQKLALKSAKRSCCHGMRESRCTWPS
ncbi:unnamed protein product, partial [Symbiodinium sp. KB8]